MYRINLTDDLYAHIVFDNDVDYMVLDETDDEKKKILQKVLKPQKCEIHY